MGIKVSNYVTDEVIVQWRTLGGIAMLADVFCRKCHRVSLVLCPPKAFYCICGLIAKIPAENPNTRKSLPEKPQANVGVIEWVST